MKKFVVYGMLIVLIGLVGATTHALASPLAVAAKSTGNPHETPTPEGTLPVVTPDVHGKPPKTPGAAATAHAGLHGKPLIYRGTITGVDASSLSLTLLDGSSVTVGLTPDTKIHVPGPQSMGDTLSMGMHVVVMAFNDQGNMPVARMVIVIPGQPVRAHRVGNVTAYTAGSSITIQATDGATYTFSLTGDTRILLQDQASSLAVGSRVTIIAPRVPSSLGWTATGIVVHPSQ